ncbi:peptidoglycan DD-metalloendopeptidase family protein [Neobacillus fumarioli]|uniref:peptidoglycan DD-metalloendopeptidase family protein n=1 Tax=Neobacillus fumarioli TaxID=105229 RepID=UPI00082E37AE|nr:peptidoglycan DD-metalloendopeptidase family protein [Neobacillus fumarioli]
MARSSADEIRRRIAKRKKSKESSVNGHDQHIIWPGDSEYEFPTYTSDNGTNDENHPLFRKEVFFFKFLASVLLFLAVAILFRNHSATLAPVRDFVTRSMDTDFKFAVVSDWYEKKFGKPLALLPFSQDDQKGKTEVVQTEYAVPAMGKILENFQKNGQGIMIETQKGAAVQVIKDGFVNFAGVKDGLGKTVIVQHSDGSETWYGNLADIKVNLYQKIKNRTVVGTVSTSPDEDPTKGKYYFAIKKDDHFVDPSKVIRFE